MRVIANTEKCIASGNCALTYPQVFAQRESDGVVHILNEHPFLDCLNKIRQTVHNCPALVFTIEDEQNTSELTMVEISQDMPK